MIKENVQRYRAGVDDWRVRMDLLAVELEGVDAGQLPELHEALAKNERRWLIARRLFGFRPVLPSPKEDPDNLQIWNRDGLASALGISVAHLRSEVDAIRGVWLGLKNRTQQLALEVAAARVEPKVDERGQAELELKPDKILEEHGFTEAMFAWKDRPTSETHAEREWLAGRLNEWGELLRNAMSKTLARQALMTEMQFRRLELKVLGVDPSTDAYKAASTLSAKLQDQFSKQLVQLDELVPSAGVIAGKMKFQGVMSEVIRGIQEYQSNPNNELADGVFTAMEIQVLMRRSVQATELKYRAELVVYLNAARDGLFDPKWINRFPRAQLRALQAGWREGAAACLDAEGAEPTDLLDEGPKGEYPPLVNADGEAVTAPA